MLKEGTKIGRKHKHADKEEEAMLKDIAEPIP
jgi:hypothetical protein